MAAALLAGLVPGLGVAPARAASLDAVDAVRRGDCGPREPGKLRRVRALDAAARAMAGGRALGEALRAAGYRADEAVAIRVGGATDDRGLARVLERRYCDDLKSVALSEAGSFRRGDDLWLIVAAPFRPPSAREQPRVAERVLALVNAARVQGRRCGTRAYPAGAPLAREPRLDAAALAHARDMARSGRFAHEGSDGSDAGTRVERQGYAARRVGENIAAGAPTPEEVVQGWLDSPGHCANIMDARFAQMGLGYVADPGSRHGIYWAQVLATPGD